MCLDLHQPAKVRREDVTLERLMRGHQFVGIISRIDLVRALTPAVRKVSEATSETSAVRRRMTELRRQA
jgi:hypothetical protein